MSEFNPVLNQILTENKRTLEKGSRDLFVFDLDSTLFDVSPRIREILLDFTKISGFQKKYSEQIEKLRQIQLIRQDWGIKTALARLGLDEPESEFYRDVKAHWFSNFFSNDYLHHDAPYLGAQQFVNLVHSKGNKIAYLTGRDVDRMLEGTIASLTHHGFPIKSSDVELALKPQKELSDTDFKRDWFGKVSSEDFINIWFFENEPLNVNFISEHFPQVKIIFFDSTHSGRAEALPHFQKINQFHR